jgi:fatty acid desaturase
VVFLFFWLIKKARRRTAGQRQRCVCRGSKTRIQYRRSGAADAGWLEQNIVAVRGLAFIWLAVWGGFFFACAALLVVVLLGWPFLALLVVYWRCPCAGRHLLSLPPQRK